MKRTQDPRAALRSIKDSFLRFVLVGGVGFLIEAALLTALVREAHWVAWHGRLITFPLAVTATWWLNRRYAFRGTRNAAGRAEYAAYFAIQLGGAALNFGVFALCLRLEPALGDWPAVPLAVGGIAGLLFNFAVARTVLYRAPNRVPEAPAEPSSRYPNRIP